MAVSKIQGRPLHWVFKIADRKKTMDFYRNVLGMKVGYGAEDSHFVVELTYNYGIGKYHLGNDFNGITIRSKSAAANARKILGQDIKTLPCGSLNIKAPDGYDFYILDEESPTEDPVQKVTLSSTDIEASVKYWKDLLGMEVVKQEESKVKLQYGPGKAQLELVKVDKIDRGTAYGRIAFSVPTDALEGIEAKVKAAGGQILTPFVKLDTPGKATVCVVILADPDSTEICFVGDEAFRELSQIDPEAEKLLDEAMDKDKSAEYFEKKGRSKPEAK